MKILILEDQKILAHSMQECLSDFGHEVTCFANSEEALYSIYDRSYDLLLLDVNVKGDLNGFELLKYLRESAISVATIFVTSLSNIQDLVQGYALGCCDYIRKPFDLTELKLRVEHAMKMHGCYLANSIVSLPYGYVYDFKKRELSLNEGHIFLSITETKILETLIKYEGSVVSHETFCQEVWEDPEVEDSNIRVQLNTLRRKLKHDFIVNVHALGYRIDF